MSSWVYDYFFVNKKESEVDVIKATYKDNPFLDKDYIRTLESLKDQNETFYKIYALGEFAQPENIIYSNWQVVSSFPDSFDEVFYGLDFGYNNPTALIEVGIKDDNYYTSEKLYQSKIN